MAGPPSNYKSSLIKMSKRLGIDRNIIWSNFLKNDLKFAAIVKSDAMVLSSHGENFGISIIESLSMGRPVLITNKVNISHYIKKTNSGLISNNTVKDYHRILSNFINLSRKSKKKMSKNAFYCYIKYFNLINSNNKFISMLKKKNKV